MRALCKTQPICTRLHRTERFLLENGGTSQGRADSRAPRISVPMALIIFAWAPLVVVMTAGFIRVA